MGLAKYERVKDYGDEEDDENGQEVELGNRPYNEASSSLTGSSPSPPVTANYNHKKNKHSAAGDYRIRRGGAGQNAQQKAVLNTVLWTVLSILLYFTLSIGLTFYQSALLEVRFCFHFSWPSKLHLITICFYFYFVLFL